MIHHIDFAVSQFDRSRDFYVWALAPLGMSPIMTFTNQSGQRLAGFGLQPNPEFWTRRRSFGGTLARSI
jgi:catechol 2,3-dioxygenase-like lactoylglutathione lyase family enzyme